MKLLKQSHVHRRYPGALAVATLSQSSDEFEIVRVPFELTMAV